MINFKFKQFLAFSAKNKKYFYTEFGNGLNVIHGRNTSGKSTLIQLILYGLGVNDDRIRLSSILSENIFVRLDCELKKNNDIEKIVFVRKDDVIYIRYGNKPILRYTGIDANQSNEHIKLKEFINELFEFNLYLESKSGIGKAPIETIFLPYYVAQSVGWVYLRKSFSNLDFYKNFKEDYLDYYLGIENTIDRAKKQELEKELQKINEEVNFLAHIKVSNEEIKIAQLVDENHTEEAFSYIKDYSEKQDRLLKLDNDYVTKCNELGFYNQRLSVISKVKRNHSLQQPGENNCPVCAQLLPQKIEDIYIHFQESNDTEKELNNYKDKAKKLQSEINSIEKKINELRTEVLNGYQVYQQYQIQKVTVENWLNNKANLKLYDNITTKLGELVQKQIDKKDKLKEFKTEDEINISRNKKSSIFEQLFKINIADMGLPMIEEKRFLKLYEISSFPCQGVELLQTVMCYHFAFNKLISETINMHRLPFILDGVFKEDIDGVNREKILKFIYKNRPIDTQTILSIADAKRKDSSIDSYNTTHFEGKAKLICIGEGIHQRAVLKEYNNEQDLLVEDSYKIMEYV